jgi:hypothetical protein
MLTLEVILDGKKIPADTPDKWEALDRFVRGYGKLTAESQQATARETKERQA